MKRMRPKHARLRFDPVAYENLRREVLRRDSWRCQSCGAMSNLEIHHQHSAATREMIPFRTSSLAVTDVTGLRTVETLPIQPAVLKPLISRIVDPHSEQLV
jgi:5-methylcytosine-specific restriction endonuclease McrA